MSDPNKYLNAMHQSTLLTNQMVKDVEAIVELVLEVENTYIMAGLKITQATEYELIGVQTSTSLPNYMLKRELVTLEASLSDLKKTIERSINQGILTVRNSVLTEADGPSEGMDTATAKAFDEYRSVMLTCTRVLEELSKRLFDAEVTLNHAK